MRVIVRERSRWGALGLLAAVAVMLAVPMPAQAQVMPSVEGVTSLEPVRGLHNAGPGDSGSAPAPDSAVLSTSVAPTSTDADALGGTGDPGNEPSSSTTVYFVTDAGDGFNVPGGFETVFSFFYTSTDGTGFVEVFDGLDGTGNVLGHFDLPALGDNCQGDPGCNWAAVEVPFTGIARSVRFGGFAYPIGFGNITFGAPASSPSDTQPPTATLTISQVGATSTVSGVIDGLVQAQDSNGVVQLALYIDGQLVGQESAGPWAFQIDTTTLTDGAHVVQARAYDPSGNEGLSNAVTIEVANAPAEPPPSPAAVSDSAPGSVIVFPKFVKGHVTIAGVAVPKSEFEISVLCPAGTVCPKGMSVKLRGHWVCPGSQDPPKKFVCKGVDFSVFITVNGTITLNPSKVAVPGSTTVPAASCPSGYLILWVTDTADRPIKFDGVIGDAVIRSNGKSVRAYNGVPIQADPALARGAVISLVNGALAFDGAPGHYRARPGVVSGAVRFDRLTGATVNTFLTLLTLDVLSNRPNFPTFVDLVFWNQDEVGTSVSTDFLCWAELELTADIAGNLNEVGMGTRKGSFLSDQAKKVAIFGVSDTAGPVSLLGIVETQEFTERGALAREYSYSLYHDGTSVPTKFKP